MASSHEEKLKKVIKEAKENYDFIRFSFADLHGIGRSKIVPSVNSDSLFKGGICTFAGRYCIQLFTYSHIVTVIKGSLPL